MRSLFVLALLLAATRPAAQLATGDRLVLTRTAVGGAALLGVDPVSGSVVPLRGFAFDGRAPLACAWDPVGRDAIVAVDDGGGALVVRVDPRRALDRVLGRFAAPVLAIAFDEAADLVVLTGGPNGAFHALPRNGGASTSLWAMPDATAAGFFERFPIAWVAQSTGPGAVPTVTFVDPRLGSVLVPPIALPALAGRRVTGVVDLPTGALREVLTDDQGGVHLLEFGTTLRTLAVTPALPPGSTVRLAIETSTSIDALVLGGAGQPFLHRVPVFGAPPVATRLAGPLPGAPVDFARVDNAADWQFGADCGGAFGAKSFLATPGLPGFFEARGAPRAAPALAVFGVDEQVAGALPLPTPLPGGCALLVSPDVVLGIVTTSGGLARVDFPVPAVLPPGFALHAQWLFPASVSLGATLALTVQREP